MSSSNTKPTILIIPGSFGPPHIYSTLITHLRSAGYPSFALQLPSTVKRMPLPPATMSDDADAIRRAVEICTEDGKEVVVVCHSYGGTPTSQGVAGLRVKRVVYLSAIVPRVGETQISALWGEGGELPMEETEGYLHIDTLSMFRAICSDLPLDLAYESALNFQHHSAASFKEAVTAVGYKDIPVSYLFCEDDLVVSPEMQRKFIGVIEEAKGKSISVVNLKAGHAPNFSIPEELARVVVQEAERVE